MRGLANFLEAQGLLNESVGHISNLLGESREELATWCSSFQCSGNSTRANGTPIHVGKFPLNRCSRCGQTEYVKSDTVGVARASLLRDEIEDYKNRRGRYAPKEIKDGLRKKY